MEKKAGLLGISNLAWIVIGILGLVAAAIVFWLVIMVFLKT